MTDAAWESALPPSGTPRDRARLGCGGRGPAGAVRASKASKCGQAFAFGSRQRCLQGPGSWASLTAEAGGSQSGCTPVLSPFPAVGAGLSHASLRRHLTQQSLTGSGHRSPEMRGRRAGLSHAPGGTPSQVRRLPERGAEARLSYLPPGQDVVPGKQLGEESPLRL